MAEVNKAGQIKTLYKLLTDEEKYEFLKSLDEMGGMETYTVGAQIDEFIEEMESRQ